MAIAVLELFQGVDLHPLILLEVLLDVLVNLVVLLVPGRAVFRLNLENTFYNFHVVSKNSFLFFFSNACMERALCIELGVHYTVGPSAKCLEILRSHCLRISGAGSLQIRNRSVIAPSQPNIYQFFQYLGVDLFNLLFGSHLPKDFIIFHVVMALLYQLLEWVLAEATPVHAKFVSKFHGEAADLLEALMVVG